ncbi:cell wall hydrolase [Leisingera caerulea]|uniref:Cell wall hydrolase n=1 Tax=Leisingera caerulea TaxID=506591 RepID=A0ABY5WZ60_LEICA|nr:cell wall hydrolase [Leisingera caerulea]UWQ59426.1 cell wall hydrolase [Leisingera caerulea]
MGNFFYVNYTGPNGETAGIFAEPNESLTAFFPYPYLLKIPHEADSEDWIFVENHEDDSGATRGRGWMRTWAVGEPIPSDPISLSAASLTLSAIRHELDESVNTSASIAADFFIALFLLENQVDLSAEPDKNDVYLVNNPIATPDKQGAYSISTAQWDAFLLAEGDKLKGWAGYHKELPLPQMWCAVWLARENRKDIGAIRGASATDPFVPRLLDLLLAHLIGAKAAAEVVRLEAEDEGMNRNIKTILRNVYGWNDESPELVALFGDRPNYLGPLTPTGGTTGGMHSVEEFLTICRENLAEALGYSARLIDLHVPGFQITLSDATRTWMERAMTEHQTWQDDNWVEQTEPGLSRAKDYFKATSYPLGQVGIGPDNELTHWCGAFVAYCMKEAGQSIPMGAAAAANWRKWGDGSVRWRNGDEVPVGAVVMTAGNQGTSRISHVNFVADWQPGEEYYLGLGGNQSDSVTIAPFRKENIAEIRVLSRKTASTNEDAVVLAKTLYGEIRGGNDEQTRNVANVVLNRFFAGYRSQGSIAGVCLAHKQFSCWNPGTQARDILDRLPEDDPTYLVLLALAQEVIANRTENPDVPPPLENARHYHNYHAKPDWAEPSKEVHRDGKHIFYRDIA